MKTFLFIVGISLLTFYGAPEQRQCRIVGKGMICITQPGYRHWIDNATRLLP